MLKLKLAALIILTTAGGTFALTDLQKLVNTELAFAKKAADTNTRAAFLEYMMEDGVVFDPIATPAKPKWEARAINSALLAWRPVWADITPDGSAGWTTGPWEFHPKGKDDKPVAFGQFVTFWLRQPNGNYRWAADIGISHDEPKKGTVPLKFPRDAGAGGKRMALRQGDENLRDVYYAPATALDYARHLADDAIILREGAQPLLLRAMGRGKALAALASLTAQKFAADGDAVEITVKSRWEHGNLSYVFGEYGVTGKTTATGKDTAAKRYNFFQIWKYRGGRWQIVLDLVNDIPAK